MLFTNVNVTLKPETRHPLPLFVREIEEEGFSMFTASTLSDLLLKGHKIHTSASDCS